MIVFGVRRCIITNSNLFVLTEHGALGQDNNYPMTTASVFYEYALINLNWYKFLADLPILGVSDSFGIDVCHSVREKRFPRRNKIRQEWKV